MVRKSEQGAALAVVQDDDASALAAALEGFDFGLNDGLQDVDPDDIRLPVMVWNLKGKDPNNPQVLRKVNEFYDTLNERTYSTLTCAFVQLQKSRAFTRFNNEKNENVIYCSSHDRVIGRMRTQHPDLPQVTEGTERRCESCPDKEWQRNSAGKNVRNCDQVYGVFATHLNPETLEPTDGFLLRFKRTGLPPFKTHMQKHHIGRMMLPGGKRANVPLYSFAVEMRLEVSDNGNYATPVIVRGRVLPRQTVAILHDQAKYWSEAGEEATRAAERAERMESAADAPGASGGATLGADDFAD